MIKKIKDIIVGSKVPPESVFERYCTDKKPPQKMNHADFKKFVKFYHEKAVEHEIDSLFKHFDQSMKGHITKEEFITAFGRDVKEQIFKISIEDIIKPLATKITKFNVNVAQLFDKYDQNKNGKLSAEELSKALQLDMNIKLTDDEVQSIKEYFINKHHSSEIRKMDFIDLINTKFERHFDTEEAKQSLITVKQKLASMNSTVTNILTPFDQEKTGRLSLRNFKVAVHQLHCLNQYGIDNLARYMDKENEGFIAINQVDVAVKGATVHLTGTSTFS